MYAVSKPVELTDAEGLMLQQIVDGMLQTVLPVLPFLQESRCADDEYELWT
jgi:hypothetical protein